MIKKVRIKMVVVVKKKNKENKKENEKENDKEKEK